MTGDAKQTALPQHCSLYFYNYEGGEPDVNNSSKHVLVTGGAGFIGSHTAKALASASFIPVSYDNLSNGHRWAVQWGPFVEGDIGDRVKLTDVIRQYEVCAILHFAAIASVAESIAHPERYYDNNVTKSLTLLEVAARAGIEHIVFSSSCATYGTPDKVPIDEDTLQQPVNPYGETKLIVERALHWYSIAHPLTSVTLRYFNAAGADLDGRLGEVHNPETHLIPLALAASDEGRTIDIYGDDYPTRDGSCIRDFVHVTDLADAHVRALHYLFQCGPSIALNLGTSEGHTVKEVICAVEARTQKKVECQIAPRRQGDPAILVADSTKAQRVLDWKPQYSSLESIVDSAWRWHCGANGR